MVVIVFIPLEREALWNKSLLIKRKMKHNIFIKGADGDTPQTWWKNDYSQNIAVKMIGRLLWFMMLPTIRSIMSWKDCANSNLPFCIWYSSGRLLMKHIRHMMIHLKWTVAPCLGTFRRYACTFGMDICKHVTLPRYAKTWHIRIHVAPCCNLSPLEVPTMGSFY